MVTVVTITTTSVSCKNYILVRWYPLVIILIIVIIFIINMLIVHTIPAMRFSIYTRPTSREV